MLLYPISRASPASLLLLIWDGCCGGRGSPAVEGGHVTGVPREGPGPKDEVKIQCGRSTASCG